MVNNRSWKASTICHDQGQYHLTFCNSVDSCVHVRPWAPHGSAFRLASATTDRVDSEVSLCVRQIISDHTDATVEGLSPQTNLANEFGFDEDRLTSTLIEERDAMQGRIEDDAGTARNSERRILVVIEVSRPRCGSSDT